MLWMQGIPLILRAYSIGNLGILETVVQGLRCRVQGLGISTPSWKIKWKTERNITWILEFPEDYMVYRFGGSTVYIRSST